jgi:hypothetical protein
VWALGCCMLHTQAAAGVTDVQWPAACQPPAMHSSTYRALRSLLLTMVAPCQCPCTSADQPAAAPAAVLLRRYRQLGG